MSVHVHRWELAVILERHAAGSLGAVEADLIINFGCNRGSDRGMNGDFYALMEGAGRPEGVRPPPRFKLAVRSME